jgi:hypothetical protein
VAHAPRATEEIGAPVKLTKRLCGNLMRVVDG